VDELYNRLLYLPLRSLRK